MTRAGAYGQSFALKHLTEGRIEQALAEADKMIAQDAADPEPVLDRAQILLSLQRYDETVATLEQAMTLDKAAMVLDDSVIDDTLFSTLVAWGQQLAPKDATRAVEVMGRYGRLLPDGTHHEEASSWLRRFRGERTIWTKGHDE